MSAAAAAAKPGFDRQGEQSDAARLGAAMHGFVGDFGRTAALHLESCVHCGACADACPFHIATREAKYTPIHKLEPFRRAYLREASAWAPLIRALGLVKAPTVADLAQWQELLYDSCTMCGRCTLACPMGIDIADLVKSARHGMFDAGLVPDRLALMDRAARQWGSTATPGEDLPDILVSVNLGLAFSIAGGLGLRRRLDQRPAHVRAAAAVGGRGQHRALPAAAASAAGLCDAVRARARIR